MLKKRGHPDKRLSRLLFPATRYWLVPNYTAWWQRHMCVNNLPRVALDSGAAGIWTRKPSTISQRRRDDRRFHTNIKICCIATDTLKIIGKEFQKNCYKTIFRKINTEEIFFQLTLITNKDYFSRKKLSLRKFTVAVHVIYIYGRDVTHWCQLWMFVNIVSKYCLFIS